MIVNEEQIKSALTIEEVVDKFVDLKRRGANLMGLCPFHNEKTPSFSVSPSKGIFKCFGCGKGGDAIEFLMEHQQFSYSEALQWMADQAGVRVEYDKSVDRDELEKRREHRKALQTSLNALVDENVPTFGSSFLIGERRYSVETGNAFRLFYALNGWCRESGVGKKSHLQELGLLKTSDKYDGLYEQFRERYMFPIMDVRGAVRGFTGRIHEDYEKKKVPKYINSTESLLYIKGEHLYGLYQAKESIRKKEFAYLVEGATDVLTMYDQGLQNVVASLGTSLTESQCKLLKRHTNMVIILRDGDEAGRKAAERDIRVCVQVGLIPKVIFLPDEMDPDDFLRAFGVDQLKEFINENTRDGIIYLSTKDYKRGEPFAENQSHRVAAELLVELEDEGVRESYIRALTQKEYFGSVKRKLRDVIKALEEERMDKGMVDLTKRQQQDIIKYGVYEKGGCYYISGNRKYAGYSVSNFVIRPIMIVIGPDTSLRLVEVVNEHGHRFVEPIDSDAFVELSGFKKAVEAQGNYIFDGNPQQFLKIKKKVYEQMPACYPIQTMGWHSAGFYAWANGLSRTDGTFHKVDEYGIVSHGEKKYYLPAFSMANLNGGVDDDGYEDLRKFIYVNGECPAFSEWAERMNAVHGSAGVVGVIWSIAALYRDIIMKELRCFPHLFLFGPPESGKSYLGWSLSSLFGEPNQPFHLTKGTNVGFSRRLAQVRNGISWFDEYSNSIHYSRVEGLKGAYDGTGHERGVKSMDNRTSKTKPLSACLISGQQVPVKDPALFTRCITLSFQRRNHSQEEKERGKALKDIEASGILSQITAYLQKYRSNIKRLFAREYSETRNMLEGMVKGPSLRDRMLMNYAVPLTVMRILEEAGVEFPWTVAHAMDVLIEKMQKQAKQIVNEDEVGVWWQIFEYLHADDHIQAGVDFSIAQPPKFSIIGENGGTEELHFEKPTTVLFVNFSRTHGLYQDYIRRQKSITGLALNELRHYLEQQPYFLGHCKARRFQSGTKAAYAFRIGYGVDELQLDISMDDEDEFPERESFGDIKKEKLEEEKEFRDNRPDPDDPGEELPF